MKLIVISSPNYIKEEIRLINVLFEEGLELLHWRKPDLSAEDSLRSLEGIKPDFRNRIVIHQHHEIANSIGTTRLHFTEKERLKYSHKKENSLKSGKTISTSIHSLVDYMQVSESFDYIFFSPVFNSISKPGYQSVIQEPFSLPKRTAKQAERIALGGVQANNLTQVFSYGFEGAAVLGAIWQNTEKTITIFKHLLKLCKQPDLIS